MDTLDLLEAQLTEGLLEAALVTALGLWRNTPDPGLAELCVAIEAKSPAPTLPTDPWKTETSQAGSVPLRTLIAALLPAHTSGALADRVDLLVARGPDARIGVALEGLLRKLPFTSNSARANLARVFDRIGEVGAIDPRFVGIAATLDQDWDVRPDQKAWMFKRFARVGTMIDRTWPEKPRIDPERLARMRAAIHTPEPRPTTVEDLYAAVYAHPDDDTPRQVLLDALLEADDPRGTYLALAFADTEPERQQALLEAHGTTWLGELAPFAKVRAWNRGFPSVAEVEFPQPRDVLRHGTHPAWATLDEVILEGPTIGTMLTPFIEHIAPTIRSLKTSGPALATCMTGIAFPELERLKVRVMDRQSCSALAAQPLPALRHLRVATPEVAWLRDAVWLNQLETLEIREGGLHLLPHLWAVVLELQRLRVATTLRGTLSRGSDGRMTAFTLAQLSSYMHDDPDLGRGPAWLPEALSMFADSALTEITLDPAAPAAWEAPVEALIARSTRLRRATVGGATRSFEREGALVVERPVPILEVPRYAGCGAAGLWVAQAGQLLRVDPATDAILEVLDVGVQSMVAVGTELAWGDPKTITWRGRWTRPAHCPNRLVFVGGGLLALGRAAQLFDADGEIRWTHAVPSLQFIGGALSPEGDRIALVGHGTRLRILDLEGGRARMVSPAKPTLAVAWTARGLWLAASDQDLCCMDDRGAVLLQVPFRPTALQAWNDGVVASGQLEVVVFDGSGEVVLRTPGWRGWPTEAGLVVQLAVGQAHRYRYEGPRFQIIPWPGETAPS